MTKAKQTEGVTVSLNRMALSLRAAMVRWVDWLAYTFIGGVVGYILMSSDSLGEQLHRSLGSVGYWELIIAASIGWGIFFGKRPVLVPLGLRRIWVTLAFPSVLSAGLTAFAGTYFVLLWTNPIMFEHHSVYGLMFSIPKVPILSLLSGFGIGLAWKIVHHPKRKLWDPSKLIFLQVSNALRRLWEWHTKRGSNPSVGRVELQKKSLPSTATENSANQLTELSDEEFIEWIQEETPVESLTQDRLKYGSLVRRYCRLLIERPRLTFALQGHHGSGKSSIMRMVENEVKSSSLHFVHIRGWGIREGHLSKFILSRTVDAIHKLGIDCTPVRSVPAEYVAAISAFSGRWSGVLKSLTGVATEPDKVVELLDPMLVATGIRLVVCIEDVDRSCSTADFQQLCALLDQFRCLNNITFMLERSFDTDRKSVTHGISEHQFKYNQNSNPSAPIPSGTFSGKYTESGPGISADLIRFCDHIETIPDLLPDNVWQLILVLHSHCMEKADKRIIFDEENDKKMWKKYDYIDKECSRVFRQYRSAIKVDLPKLMRTPRILKQIFREVLTVWPVLKNEINFTDLLFGKILLRSAPEAYEFMASNISTLRQLNQRKENDPRWGWNPDKEKDKLREEWHMLSKNDWDQNTAGMVLSLLGFDIFSDRSHNNNSRFQGIASSDRYWRRFQAGELDKDELSDKEVLLDLYLYLKDEEPPETIAQKSYNNQSYKEKLEEFFEIVSNKLFPSNQLSEVRPEIPLKIRALLSESHLLLYKDLIEREFVTFKLFIIPLAGLVANRGNNVITAEWLTEEVSKYIGKHFPLASTILGIFRKHIIPTKTDINKTIIKELKKQINESEGDFWCKCLYDRSKINKSPENRGKDPANISSELIFFLGAFYDNWQEHVQEWSWLVPSLFSSAKKCPCKCVPALVHLVIDWQRGGVPDGKVTWAVKHHVLYDFIGEEKFFVKIKEIFDSYRQEHAEDDPYTCQVLNHIWNQLEEMNWNELNETVQTTAGKKNQQANESQTPENHDS